MMKFNIKSLIVLKHDFLWVPVAIFLAFWFRFNFYEIPAVYQAGMLELMCIAIPVHGASFWFFGCYRGVWRFASIPDLWRLLRAIFVGALVTSIIVFLYSRFEGVPRSAIFLYPILLFIGVSTSRIVYRVMKTHHFSLEKEDRDHALIVGAGKAGNFLIRDILENREFIPVGIVDDNPRKQGADLLGVRVLGKLSNLSALIEAHNVQVVLIAMPSASRKVMSSIIQVCAEKQIPCRTLPSLNELAQGQIEVSKLRPVTVEDLLGRDPVKLDEEAINSYISGKRVAITGGGGSIGSELCRQVLMHMPSSLLILDSSEFNLYSIEQELKSVCSNAKMYYILANVRFEKVIEKEFNDFKPDVVFNAAAYKHVPLLESNVVSAVNNNVFGTKSVADVAAKVGVKTFVQVSTDKTVNPTNVMGATKRVAEIYCQILDSKVATNFVTTRFGNVLGSAGSVVPMFQEQINSGGPVTVTHPDITRFFMTIPEAASLILQAGAMGEGGAIYVLDMGKPVKIDDLAKKMIRLSGLEEDKDVAIDYVGLRPGEKMHEELFYEKESLVGTSHGKLLLAYSKVFDVNNFELNIKCLSDSVEKMDEELVISRLKRIVPEFNASLNSTVSVKEKPLVESNIKAVK